MHGAISMTAEQTLELAREHYRAGRYAQAREACGEILAGNPNHAEALHLLGRVERQSGRTDAALELFNQAVAAKPDLADAHFDRAKMLRAAGKLDESITASRRAIELLPNHAEAWTTLGNALNEQGKREEAIEAYDRAIASKPRLAEAHFNRANVLRELKRLDESIASYRNAAQLKPDFVEAHVNLGIALYENGRLDEAAISLDQAIERDPKTWIAYSILGDVCSTQGQAEEAIGNYRAAIAVQPNSTSVHFKLGRALCDAGRLEEAIAALSRAIELKPDHEEAHDNLGVALQRMGRLDDAIAAYRRALGINPMSADAHFNLGTALGDKNQFDEAIAAYRQAIAFRPDHAEAHWCLGCVHLRLGNFEAGWKEYEWRLKGSQASILREFPRPRWTGQDLEGKTILIHPEQGFGDMIQFIRYVPLLAQRGAKIVLCAPPELVRLLSNFPNLEQVVPIGERLPDDMDFYCPLMSLPVTFGTNLETIPNQVPYIHPLPELVSQWAQKLGPKVSGLRVGLVWAGTPAHKADRVRSLRLDQFAALGAVKGIEFYSLQKGHAASGAQNPPPGMNLIDRTDELSDFADTAALIANLDLVISVDTAAAHLAGALAKPVWTLLGHAADFRWLLNRQDSPWYPTMQLFRQKTFGDWETPVREMAAALHSLAKQRAS